MCKDNQESYNCCTGNDWYSYYIWNGNDRQLGVHGLY